MHPSPFCQAKPASLPTAWHCTAIFVSLHVCLAVHSQAQLCIYYLSISHILRFRTMYSYQFEMSSSNYTSSCQSIKNYMVMMVILYFQSQRYLLHPVLSAAVSLLSQMGLQSRWGKEQSVESEWSWWKALIAFSVFKNSVSSAVWYVILK